MLPLSKRVLELPWLTSTTTPANFSDSDRKEYAAMADESPDQGDTKSVKDVESSQDEDDTIGEEEDVASVAEEDDDDDEDEEEDEPKLKYARLTSHLGAVYRNADATSAFLVAGDKMVGTRPDELRGCWY